MEVMMIILTAKVIVTEPETARKIKKTVVPFM
jgi:hypothetical protein